MSTKNQTSTQFNQSGMDSYNSMMPSFSNAVNGYMNNPFSNPFFQTQQQMGNNQANMMGQTAMSNISRNNSMSGIASNSPAALEMMNNQSRQNSSNRANLGFLSPMQNAFTAQQNSMSMAGNFKPLQTGQTQTQSGLGSWLPSLLGGGLSMLTGGLMGKGGAGGAAMGAMSGTMGAMNAAMSPMQSGMGGSNNPFTFQAPGAGVGGDYNFGPSPFSMGQPSY